jgi:dienelactone hydrolase
MRTRTRGVGPWALVCAVLLACTPPAGAPTQPPTVGGLTPAPTAAAPPTSPAPIATRRPTDDLPDPGAPGPYAVGATRRTTARTLANGDRRGIGLEVSYPALPADPLMGNLTGPPALAGPHPVVVFSHGHGAQPHHYRPAIEHLASHGFVVVAPVHNDCVNCLGEDQLLGQNLRRTGDVSAALDAVLALSAGDDGILRGVADPVRVGVAGHSRGGYTTLRALEEDDRLLAGLALAPSTWGGRATAAPDPARVARPLMIIQGEWDAQVPYDGVAEFFERIPATAPNRWFVGFPRTGHAFWDECVDGRMSVRPCSAMLAADQVGRAAKRWGTAFLLRHVAGDVRYDPLLDPAAAAGAEYSVYLAAAGSSAPLLPPAGASGRRRGDGGGGHGPDLPVGTQGPL